MDQDSEAKAAIAKRADEIVQQLFDFLDTLPDKDHNGFTVLLALAWCTGHQIRAFPDECRAQMREIACDEMNGVVNLLEEEGAAGTARAIRLN